MLLASLAAFAIGSLAESSGLAIAGRVIQGLGSAVTPLTYGLARDTVAPERLPHAIGAVVGGASAGAAIGFLLSGLLVDTFSAAAVFWFLLGFAILIAIAVRVLVRESPVRAVVVRSAAPDSTSVAVAVNAVTRNTAVAIGAQVAFAIIAGADVAGTFPVESAYTWVFAMGGLGAALLLLTSALMPGRTLLPAAERREPDPNSAGGTEKLLDPA